MSSFSSLNFLVKLVHLKVMSKWTNKSFDELLKLAFLKIDLINSHYTAKKLMTKMDLGYKSIYVSKNDFALFWNEKSSKEKCHMCSNSR